MAVFKVTKENGIIVYRIADSYRHFPNDYLRGSYADFYQDGYQVGTEYKVKSISELKDAREKAG